MLHDLMQSFCMQKIIKGDIYEKCFHLSAKSDSDPDSDSDSVDRV